MGVVSAAGLKTWPNGKPVRVAGLVLVRQRPGTAKGITFVTLEDETGTANLIVRRECGRVIARPPWGPRCCWPRGHCSGKARSSTC